jgi:hypothetical protein
MQDAVRKLFVVMPLLFGLGFIAPLIAQLMAAADASAPFGIGNTAFGLALGGTWGLIATLRGRWL